MCSSDIPIHNLEALEVLKLCFRICSAVQLVSAGLGEFFIKFVFKMLENLPEEIQEKIHRLVHKQLFDKVLEDLHQSVVHEIFTDDGKPYLTELTINHLRYHITYIYEVGKLSLWTHKLTEEGHFSHSISRKTYQENPTEITEVFHNSDNGERKSIFVVVRDVVEYMREFIFNQ